MSTTLLALERLVARELGYVTGTPSGAGTSTTIVDSSTDSPFDPDDSSKLYVGAWAKIEADSAGTPLNVGEVRRITSYTAGTGPTTSRAFTNATTTTMTYGVYFGMPPTRVGTIKGIDEYINDVLRGLRYREFSVLTLVTDGDMETSGVGNWTASNSTLTKNTTASRVLLGKQSLRVANSAANGYARSALVNVVEDQTYGVWAMAQAASGTAKLQLYDETNSAEIDSVTHTEQQQRWMYMSATIPSNCEQASVRLIGVEAAADTYWDCVSLRNTAATRMDLPSWVDSIGAVEELYAWTGGNVDDNDGRAIEQLEQYVVTDWQVLGDPVGATPYRIEFNPRISASRLLVLQGLRAHPQLSADTDTTDANADLVEAGVLALYYRDKENAASYAKWLGRFQALSLMHQPMQSMRMSLGLR